LYPIILALHNIVRWVVLILGVVACVRAFLGWLKKRPWEPMDRKVGMFFGISIDIQILLGLLLYFIYSPITKSALQNFGAAMKAPDVRFFAFEHVFYMVVAVVFAHLGGILPRKVDEAVSKHKRAALFFSVALLAILLGIPWMRPLLPGL
jgi:hypothetical protein